MEIHVRKAEKAARSKKRLSVALVGKYVKRGATAYQSILDAVNTAGLLKDKAVDVTLVSSEDVEKSPEILSSYNGIIIGPGFGVRGFEGKSGGSKVRQRK